MKRHFLVLFLIFSFFNTSAVYARDSQIAKRERIQNAIKNSIIKDEFSDRLQKRHQSKNPIKKFIRSLGNINWEMLGVIIPILLGISGWYFLQRKKSQFKDYFENIDSTYIQFKTKSRRCEAELYRLKDIIEEELKNGKLEENTFRLLSERIDSYLKEIRQQIVQEQFGTLPSQLMKNLERMLEDSEVSKDEYTRFVHLLKKTTGMPKEQRDELIKTVQSWKKEDAK